MKAIKIVREGLAPIHVPVQREREVFVGLTNVDDDVSIVAHSQATSDNAIAEDFWVDDDVGLGATVTLALVNVAEADEPDQRIETTVGEPRCSFCGGFESDVGELYRGTRGLAKICNACFEAATRDR